MLNLSEIIRAYPESLHMHRAFILREYLQYKILEILFEGRYASKFCFLGGTCLRLVHNNLRFSEDLDFDNFDITEAEFSEVSESIKTGLERQGYQVEMKQIIRGAYHCHIRFPGLLFEQGLSGYREERILIQLDTEPQHFDFQPEIFVLNKFDVTTSIFTTPLDLLLAQKFTALCQRKRSKGRDFFDIVFLLSKSIKPNYDYLKMKLNVSSSAQLRERVREVCNRVAMEEMVADVRSFLFNPSDEKKIKLFLPILEQADLD
ncbi:MAG: nucleotidyl transferase AbiEii/AbiGii toxin family protein [Saprospiraceae bacterium]|nr:nucleotidyl transferase AbiEii/AbiGii toxin family protein [Saprospiraceae bacterium]